VSVDAAGVATLARAGGWTVATAESITAGRVAAALAAEQDAATWFRGGIVAYSTEVKRTVLDVPSCPVVSRACADAMATNALDLLGADIAVSTTGVGGPEPADGEEPGTVWICIAGLGSTTAQRVRLIGKPPSQVVDEATSLALHSLHARLAGAADHSSVRSASAAEGAGPGAG
jgi:nicotinamide-nucleotide amidase